MWIIPVAIMSGVLLVVAWLVWKLEKEYRNSDLKEIRELHDHKKEEY